MKFKLILSVFFICILFVNVSAYDFSIRNSSSTSQIYFHVDGDSGNVGVGTDAPVNKLDVLGSMSISDKTYYKSSANLGKFQHSFASRDYVDRKDTSAVYNGSLELVDIDDQGDYAIGVWGDGNFIYLANYGGGLHTYSVDSSGILTHIDSDDTGGIAYGVWGDGDFIYLANHVGGLHTYSVNLTGELNHIDSDDQGDGAYDVWGDGDFVYLANAGGGLHTYSVNSTGGLTHIDSDDQGDYAIGVWGDGDFVYLANEAGGLHTYSVNSTGGLTHIDSDDQGDYAIGVWGDGNFIYLANAGGGLHTYSVNSTGGLTHIDSDYQGGYARGVWGDGNFIYLANSDEGLHTYSVNSTGGLTHIDSDDQGDYAYGVWGDGNFVYLANYAGGLLSYKLGKAYEYDKANQSHYFDDHVGIGIDDPSENLVVKDNMIAYNDADEGTYIGFFKGEGSLPGYATDNYPTIKSDHNIYFDASGTYAGAFTTTGFYQATTVTGRGSHTLCWDGSGASYFGNCSSLTELKKDIENISVSENLWEKYMKLQPVNYRWKDPGWQQNLQTGFLAEQVESVDPLLADYAETFNETTNEKSTELRGINFDAITSVNVLMIQDLKQENEILKEILCSEDKTYGWCKNE